MGGGTLPVKFWWMAAKKSMVEYYGVQYLGSGRENSAPATGWYAGVQRCVGQAHLDTGCVQSQPVVPDPENLSTVGS